MEIASLTLFAGALLVVAGSPGPSVGALVARVIQSGWKSVFPFLAAMWIGEAIWLTAAVLGLAALAETFDFAFLVLKYAGIAYLIYLGWQMWNAPVSANNDEIPTSNSNLRLFLAGMAVTLGNPKLILFYIALLPTLIDVEAIGFNQWLLLVAVMFVVLAAVDFSWTLFANTMRKLIKSERAMKWSNRISGSMMLTAATAIAIHD